MPPGLAHIGDVLQMHAAMFPDKVGARDLDRALTFRLWYARACRLANALTGLGLTKGDRVCVLAYNCLEWMEIYAATALAGLIAVPINFRLIGAEIQYIVENCEAKALIVQDELLESIESVRADLPLPAENFIAFGRAARPSRIRCLRGADRQSQRRRAPRESHAERSLDLDVHVRDDGQAEGRDPQPPRQRPALARHRSGDGLSRRRCRAAGHAHVPRELVVLFRRVHLLRRRLHGLQQEELRSRSISCARWPKAAPPSLRWCRRTTS